MTQRLLAVLALIALSFPLPAAGQGPAGGEAALKTAEKQAREALEQAKEEKVRRYQHLERLRKDLRYISEDLDRELLGPDKDLDGYSKGGLDRIDRLRLSGGIDPQLEPALDKLEEIYRRLPSKEYAREYVRSLVKAIDHELRWIADEAKTEQELLDLLDEHLILPSMAPGNEDAFEDLALFPVDLPLDKFKRLGPIRIFLVKHRIKRPKGHAASTHQDIVAGKHNVQVGVEIAGKVLRTYGAVDLDYCFDIGNLHVEITPEWRVLHPKMPLPKKGDVVRVKGWTYYDIFHKAEEEYDPEDPVMGASRVTLWEIHPAQETEIVSPGP